MRREKEIDSTSPRRGEVERAKRSEGEGVRTLEFFSEARAPSPQPSPLRGEGVSPPGHAHVAGQRRALVAAVDDEIVTLGFSQNRLVDGGKQQIVAFGGAQRLA